MDNLRFVLEDLKLNYGNIHCVGFGYGANQLLYYLGQKGAHVVVERSAVVSNPFDLGMCSEMIGGF
jgi:predicted alpha/beta-fold hydrolase